MDGRMARKWGLAREAMTLQFKYEDPGDGRATTNGVPVLCIGYAAETLDQRCRFLGESGYAVTAAHTRAEAVSLLASQRFAALVIGHAIPESDRLEFIEKGRARNANAIVVLLYRDSIRRAESAQAVLCVENGPLALVQALRELLET